MIPQLKSQALTLPVYFAIFRVCFVSTLSANQRTKCSTQLVHFKNDFSDGIMYLVGVFLAFKNSHRLIGERVND